MCDNASSSHDRMVTDCNAGQEDGISTHPYVILDCNEGGDNSLRNNGLAWIFIIVIQAGDDNSLGQIDIIANVNGTYNCVSQADTAMDLGTDKKMLRK